MRYLLLLTTLIFFTACQHPALTPTSSDLLSSELTGPIAASFTVEHQLTLLQDGGVLKSGGSVDGYAHARFDPQTKHWARLDSSHFGYESHGAAQLADGRVLIAGGYQSPNPITNVDKRIGGKAELFDPQTNSWSETRPMQVGRAEHSMTLLQDGTVLAVGGFYLEKVGSRDRSYYSKVAEIFDPTTESWRFAAEMHQPRANHEALLLADGRVVVLGGDVNEFHGEIYDPILDQWTMIATLNLPFKRNYRAAWLDQDHILLSGGVHESVEGSPVCAIYTLSTDQWQNAAPMHHPRESHTLITLAEGKVLALGGKSVFDDHLWYPTVDPIAACELYDWEKNRWEIVGDLRTARGRHQSILLPTTEILTVGGNADAQKGAELSSVK